jgi:hypothetical protein
VPGSSFFSTFYLFSSKPKAKSFSYSGGFDVPNKSLKSLLASGLGSSAFGGSIDPIPKSNGALLSTGPLEKGTFPAAPNKSVDSGCFIVFAFEGAFKFIPPNASSKVDGSGLLS